MRNVFELMGYEYKKLFKKKSTWITLGILLILILFSGADNLIGNTYREGKVAGTKYDEMQKNKKAEQMISGRVVEKELIIEAFDALKQFSIEDMDAYNRYRSYRNIIELGFYAAADDLNMLSIPMNYTEEDAINYYSNLKANMTRMIRKDYNLRESEKDILINNINQIKTPFLYEYSDGYTKFAVMADIIGLFLIFGTSICLAPMFSGEYGTKMDALILSSKYGKSKIITAKLLVGLSFSFLVSLIGLGISLLEMYIIYGADGGIMPIQIWGGISDILLVYPIQCLMGAIILGMCIVLASVLTAALTMFLSARIKTSFSTIIITSIIILAPLFYKISANNRILYSLFNLLPVNMMSVRNVFSIYLYTFGDISILPYHFIPVFCIIAIAIFVVFAYRGFKRHQVT